jgi:hypothetical protein
MIQRHKDSIIIGGTNTLTGDEAYSGQGAVDGSSADRFYTLFIDYDEAYEYNLLQKAIGSRVFKKAPAWQPAAAPTIEQLTEAHQWHNNLRKGMRRAKLNKIVSTRMIINIFAAMKAGIPFAECKADLLQGWSKDELARAGA